MCEIWEVVVGSWGGDGCSFLLLKKLDFQISPFFSYKPKSN